MKIYNFVKICNSIFFITRTDVSVTFTLAEFRTIPIHASFINYMYAINKTNKVIQLDKLISPTKKGKDYFMVFVIIDPHYSQFFKVF